MDNNRFRETESVSLGSVFVFCGVVSPCFCIGGYPDCGEFRIPRVHIQKSDTSEFPSEC